jgi:protein TonB
MMNVRRSALGAGLVAILASAPTLARAQDDLGGAKTLYVNASYEEALTLLDRQTEAATTPTRAAEVQHYRALCLIALGRTPEAERAIALAVASDPFTAPDTSELSPRVAAVFATTRARLLPDVARRVLAEGRQLLQKGDAKFASERFAAVVTLLSEPGLKGRAELDDLTLAANALTELAKAQIAAAPAAPVAPAPTVTTAVSTPAPPAATASSAASATTTAAPAPAGARTAPPSTTVLRPPGSAAEAAKATPSTAVAVAGNFQVAVPISQALPRWQPENSVVARAGFSGAVRVTIDATGRVTGAVMERPVYPPYDRLVLDAARNWTYKPATRNGQPVPSERVVEIQLRARGSL